MAKSTRLGTWREVPLANTAVVALVDGDDAELALKYRWQLLKGGKYAKRQYAISRHVTVNEWPVGFHRPVSGSLSLHRLIMLPEQGMDVDHWNRNGLDCRRANLRVTTRSNNLANRNKPGCRFVGLAARLLAGHHYSCSGPAVSRPLCK